MDPKLYRHIVSIIDKYKTWVMVVDSSQFIGKFLWNGTEGVESFRKVLALKSYNVRWGFVEPRKWYITMAELNKGVNRLTASDERAKARIRNYDLTLYDVEFIIETATHGVLKLGLGRYGFG